MIFYRSLSAGVGTGIGLSQALHRNVSINLRGSQRAMPQKLLYGSDVCPAIDHVGGSGVSEDMGAGSLCVI